MMVFVVRRAPQSGGLYLLAVLRCLDMACKVVEVIWEFFVD